MRFFAKGMIVFAFLLFVGLPPVLSFAENSEIPDAGASIARGWQLVDQDDLSKALGEFENALKADPSSVKAKVGKARCLLYLNKLSEAEESYKEVLKQDPANESAMLGLARAYNWQGKYDLAADEYEKYLKSFPDQPDIQKELAQVSQWSGELLAAQSQNERALSEDPRNFDALRAKAEVTETLRPYQKFFASYLTETDAGGFNSSAASYGYRFVKPLERDNRIFAEYRMENYNETGKGHALGEAVLLGGKLQANPALSFNGQLDLRTYSKAVDFFTGGMVNGVWNYHDKNNLTLQYEHDLFDVFDDMRSNRYSAELKNYLLKQVSLTDYYQFADISDGNNSRFWQHSLTWEIFKRTPDLSFTVGYRNRDYDRTSPQYYSPRDLGSVLYSVYVGKSIAKTYSYATFKYFNNSDKIDSYAYAVGSEYSFQKDLSLGAEVNYFNTTEKYHALGVSLALHWRF